MREGFLCNTYLEVSYFCIIFSADVQSWLPVLVRVSIIPISCMYSLALSQRLPVVCGTLAVQCVLFGHIGDSWNVNRPPVLWLGSVSGVSLSVTSRHVPRHA